MSDLNEPKKVNDLIEALILASSRKVKVKVLRESVFTILIDGIPYEFRIDFDPQTGLWFLDS